MYFFAVISLEKIGVPNVMFLHCAMSFALLVFVILCIPETKGRTLEEISKELAKKWASYANIMASILSSKLICEIIFFI